jgi:hypothetical protein
MDGMTSVIGHNRSCCRMEGEIRGIVTASGALDGNVDEIGKLNHGLDANIKPMTEEKMIVA